MCGEGYHTVNLEKKHLCKKCFFLAIILGKTIYAHKITFLKDKKMFILLLVIQAIICICTVLGAYWVCMYIKEYSIIIAYGLFLFIVFTSIKTYFGVAKKLATIFLEEEENYGK